MSRPRYASDETRKRIKPHVRIHHSITNHEKTTQVWQDNDLLARYVRVLMLASKQGSAHRSDTLVMGFNELPACMGVTRVGPARDSLLTLCRLVGWQVAVNQSGRTVQIMIRNFAKKQNLTPRLRSGELRDSAASPLPSPHTALHIAEKPEKKAVVVAVPTPHKRLAEAPKERLSDGAVDLSGVLRLFNEFAEAHPGITRSRANLSDMKNRRDLEEKVAGHPDPEDWMTALEWSYASNLVMKGTSDRPGPWLNPRWLIGQVDKILMGTYGTGNKIDQDAPPAPYHPLGSRN